MATGDIKRKVFVSPEIFRLIQLYPSIATDLLNIHQDVSHDFRDSDYNKRHPGFGRITGAEGRLAEGGGPHNSIRIRES